MFRKILLIFLFCGLIALSVILEYRASAETYVCPSPRGPCIIVKPPDCVIPDCEVSRPLLRWCEHQWREPLIGNAIRCPQRLCFVDVKMDRLQTVARVSTLNIMRAIGR